MQISNWKTNAAKSLKNQFWERFGLTLGWVWDSLGPLLGALGCIFTVFWTFEIELFSSIGPRWAPRGLLDRFGAPLGRSWAHLGCFLGVSWVLLGVLGHLVNLFDVSWVLFGPSGNIFGRLWEVL